MKVAVLNINKVADTTELTAISEGSLSDLDKKYKFDSGEIYRYTLLATSGDFQPDDASGSTGWWVKQSSAYDLIYPVLDSYDFQGNSATEITGANATFWTQYFQDKDITINPVSIIPIKDFGKISTTDRDELVTSGIVSIGDRCFNSTLGKSQEFTSGGWKDIRGGGTGSVLTQPLISAGGTAVNSIVFIGDELTYATAGSLNNSYSWYVTKFLVPGDYSGGGKLIIWTRRDGVIDNQDIKAWKNNVIDSTIDGTVSVLASSDVTWEKKVIVFGSTLAPHDRMDIELFMQLDNNRDVYVKDILFEYNKQ